MHKVSSTSNWMQKRHQNSSSALDRCFDERLTGHTVINRENKKVTLKDGKTYTEFISCSYLGLEQHPALIEASHAALLRFGVHLSSSRNRMRPYYLEELEELLMKIYPQAALSVFTSTSNAHLGVLPILASGELPSYRTTSDVQIFIDRTAHASMQILRGILSQFGPVERFDSSDLDNLSSRLKKSHDKHKTPLVLTDGVGSMHGLSPIHALAGICKESGGYLYIDDAHGISITGDFGAGWAFNELGGKLPENVIIAGSLSKGFGGSGGFILVNSSDDVNLIRKLANPLVFGHSVMVPMLAANVASAKLHITPEFRNIQKRLWRNINYLDHQLEGIVQNYNIKSPIRSIEFSTEEKGITVSRVLKDEGFITRVWPGFASHYLCEG